MREWKEGGGGEGVKEEGGGIGRGKERGEVHHGIRFRKL